MATTNNNVNTITNHEVDTVEDVQNEAPEITGDVPVSLSALIKELAGYPFEEIVGYLKEIGLEARFESRRDNPGNTRLLITHSKFGCRFSSNLYFQANGVVYDTAEHKVLCLPAPACNYRAKYDDIVKHFDTYKVFAIHDGTIVNLYYHNDRWTLGSANGYQINDYKWMGPNTYWDEFLEVTKQYPKFDLATLDRTLCYNIGFRSRNFHPLASDQPHAWLVSCWNPATLESATVDIGIPSQQQIDVKAIPGETSQDKFNWLLAETREALPKYLADRTRHNYGYIFRGGDFLKTGPSTNVMIESSLMRKVRRLIYNLPKHASISQQLNNNNRLEYCTLRSYLHYPDRSDFLQLFPDMKPKYEQYGKTVADIIERMIRCYRNRNLRSKLTGSARNPNSKPTLDSLAATFMNNIDKFEKLNFMSPQCQNIIYNYIVDVRYLNLYFSMLA